MRINWNNKCACARTSFCCLRLSRHSSETRRAQHSNAARMNEWGADQPSSQQPIDPNSMLSSMMCSSIGIASATSESKTKIDTERTCTATRSARDADDCCAQQSRDRTSIYVNLFILFGRPSDDNEGESIHRPPHIDSIRCALDVHSLF